MLKGVPGAMRVSDLSERFGVPYRDVRYVLEQGVLPVGVDESPGRGEHRDLTPVQAFWLAIVLVLKQNGVKVPVAGRVADFAKRGVKGVARSANWEYSFDPFAGKFDTDNGWWVEVGDLKYIRLVTTANPSVDGPFEFDWIKLSDNSAATDADPIVTVRLDLTRLARLLGG
jgi:hypothetical protein